MRLKKLIAQQLKRQASLKQDHRRRLIDLTMVSAVGTARSASCQQTRLRTWWRGWHDEPVPSITASLSSNDNNNSNSNV